MHPACSDTSGGHASGADANVNGGGGDVAATVLGGVTVEAPNPTLNEAWLTSIAPLANQSWRNTFVSSALECGISSVEALSSFTIFEV